MQQWETVDGFAGWLSAGLGRRPARFLRDMVTGMYRSGSVHLTEIASALDEDIHLHATHKRLSRNLAREQLAPWVADRLLEQAALAVKADTRLIICSYGLHKRYAKQMEYLRGPSQEEAAIPDGGGYRVCEILSSDVGTNTYVPLLITVWSRHAPGYTSDLSEVLSAVERVLAATGGNGIVYLDDFAISPRIIDGLIRDPALRFVSSVPHYPGEAHLVYRRRTRPLASLIDECETPFGETMYKVIDDVYVPQATASGDSPVEREMFMHFGSLPINLPGSERPLSLVVIKTNSHFGQDIGVPIVTSELSLRSRRAHMVPIAGFITTRDVVRNLRRHRASYNPADFRVLTYGRLQLLMVLLQAVIFYESRSVLVEDQMVTFEPHSGDYQRDFMLPEEDDARPVVEGDESSDTARD